MSEIAPEGLQLEFVRHLNSHNGVGIDFFAEQSNRRGTLNDVRNKDNGKIFLARYYLIVQSPIDLGQGREKKALSKKLLQLFSHVVQINFHHLRRERFDRKVATVTFYVPALKVSQYLETT